MYIKEKEKLFETQKMHKKYAKYIFMIGNNMKTAILTSLQL